MNTAESGVTVFALVSILIRFGQYKALLKAELLHAMETDDKSG
jgi:hypothetical protein